MLDRLQLPLLPPDWDVDDGGFTGMWASFPPPETAPEDAPGWPVVEQGQELGWKAKIAI